MCYISIYLMGFDMGMLSNHKHELFAQGLAQGKTQTQAYIDAGYSANGAEVSASRLLTNANIKKRVQELQNRAAVRAEITIAGLTNDLLRLARSAEALGDASGYQASRAALMDAAKLNGLIVDKQKTELTSSRSIELSQDDLKAIALETKRLDEEY